MRVILDQQIYDRIWDFIKQDFHFTPSMDQHKAAFAFPMRAACFGLKRLWDDRQEETVNGIMMSLFPEEELYALDWQHDCFTFRPNEQIPPHFHYYDSQRDTQVYFPTYYPDGDYHFFVDKSFSEGLFGHPWQQKLYVIGRRVIRAFWEKRQELDLEMLEYPAK